ncbi:hypothetical protein D6779_05910 [Candidatus Parcubacteria bacterium]|nr:MAG: hypothetical protein D6779_05910 [Candidatus Parcubacteria bacterium]
MTKPMKKTHWVAIVIGWIVLWAGTILCCLTVLQFGSESFSREELIDASEEAYRFDPRAILASDSSEDNVFVQIPFSERFPESMFTTVGWQQEDYFRATDLFMKHVLSEDRASWRVIDISSVLLCSDYIGVPNLTIRMQKKVSSAGENHRSMIHVNIMPQPGIIEILKREYAPDEGGYRTIAWDDVVIPAEQALLIAEQNGGAVVRQALGNQCRITISLTAGIQKNDWWIYYEPLNEPSVFEIAVDEKTGKYRVLREFKP